MNAPSEGEIVWRGSKPLVVWLMDADDCYAVADMIPSSDGWRDDLIAAANRLFALEGEAQR